MQIYKTNIEEKTLENTNYRTVLHTAKHMQLVVMNLKPGEDIPKETHDEIDQFIRVEQGQAQVTIDDQTYDLQDDEIIIIPAGSEHYVKNSSKGQNLKLYSIYSPAEHPAGTIHKTRDEAIEAEKHHHH